MGASFSFDYRLSRLQLLKILFFNSTQFEMNALPGRNDFNAFNAYPYAFNSVVSVPVDICTAYDFEELYLVVNEFVSV